MPGVNPIARIKKACQELANWPSGQLTTDRNGTILLAGAEMCNRIGAAKCKFQSKENWLDGYRKRFFPAGNGPVCNRRYSSNHTWREGTLRSDCELILFSFS